MNSLAHLLTKREREIMDSLAAGATYREVADLLRMPIDSITYHRKHINRKLKADTPEHAIAIWARGEFRAGKRIRLAAAQLVQAVCDIALSDIEQMPKR